MQRWWMEKQCTYGELHVWKHNFICEWCQSVQFYCRTYGVVVIFWHLCSGVVITQEFQPDKVSSLHVYKIRLITDDFPAYQKV